LEHPNAPVERRTIELTPGETLLLDITLKVSAQTKPSASAQAAQNGQSGQSVIDAQDASPDSTTP
jgi:hypothetical protein